mgnify:FL=1
MGDAVGVHLSNDVAGPFFRQESTPIFLFLMLELLTKCANIQLQAKYWRIEAFISGHFVSNVNL